MTDDKDSRSFEDLNDALLQMEPDELNARIDHELSMQTMMDPARPLPALPAPFARFSVQELMAKSFPDPRWIVKDLIGEGLTLLAGAPKIGKSWFALDLALSVSGGNDDILGGMPIEHGAVLYLALEDTQRRLQNRVRNISQALTPVDLDLMIESPRIGCGLEEQIRSWHAERKGRGRLVIIDTFARVRPEIRPRDSGYMADYTALAPLQKLAGELGIAIFVIHHTNKAPAADDPFDSISGTNALNGAADASMVLRRSGEGATLYTRGRDVEERQVTLSFDRSSFRWHQVELAATASTPERDRILRALMEAGTDLSAGEIADRIDQAKDNTQRLLSKLAAAHLVIRSGRGTYRIAQKLPVSDPDGPNDPKRPCGDNEATATRQPGGTVGADWGDEVDAEDGEPEDDVLDCPF